jgi:hypothetical protein
VPKPAAEAASPNRSERLTSPALALARLALVDRILLGRGSTHAKSMLRLEREEVRERGDAGRGSVARREGRPPGVDMTSRRRSRRRARVYASRRAQSRRCRRPSAAKKNAHRRPSPSPTAGVGGQVARPQPLRALPAWSGCGRPKIVGSDPISRTRRKRPGAGVVPRAARGASESLREGERHEYKIVVALWLSTHVFALWQHGTARP